MCAQISQNIYVLFDPCRQDGSPLLYLTAQPQVEGPGRCEYVTDVNALNIKVMKHMYGCLPEKKSQLRSLIDEGETRAT